MPPILRVNWKRILTRLRVISTRSVPMTFTKWPSFKKGKSIILESVVVSWQERPTSLPLAITQREDKRHYIMKNGPTKCTCKPILGAEMSAPSLGISTKKICWEASARVWVVKLGALGLGGQIRMIRLTDAPLVWRPWLDSLEPIST